jgi:TM2 domain-containing membrane protein YozV
MKTATRIVPGIVVLAIALSSCSVEKRTYTTGYHVEWNHRYNAEMRVDKSPDPEKTSPAMAMDEAGITAAVSPTLQEQRHETTTQTIPAASCDKAPTLNTQPTPRVGGSGETQKAGKATVAAEAISEPVHNTVSEERAPERRNRKHSDAQAAEGGGKSQVIALVLCIFLGIIGIHRFYLGYTGIGILMVVTLGVFGLLWLIDLVRIIIGTLEPKDGSYGETLGPIKAL